MLSINHLNTISVDMSSTLLFRTIFGDIQVIGKTIFQFALNMCVYVVLNTVYCVCVCECVCVCVCVLVCAYCASSQRDIEYFENWYLLNIYDNAHVCIRNIAYLTMCMCECACV